MRRAATRQSLRMLSRSVPASLQLAHSKQLYVKAPATTQTNVYSTGKTLQSLSSSFEAFDFENEDLEELPKSKLSAEFDGKKPITEFGLSDTLFSNLKKAGITDLFPVQVQSFSTMMKGVDLVGRSKTGSGKTLAFGLPIIEKLLSRSGSRRNPGALILLPTRELATQVSSELSRLSPQLKTVTIVGGVPYHSQESRIRAGVDIVVGTPGRIMDLFEKKTLSFEDVQFTVLDEADMMLKFGFQEAVETILSWVPETRQCVMWSATFPKWVTSLTKKYLKDAVTIDLVGSEEAHVPTTVSHKAINVPSNYRVVALQRILEKYASQGQSLVFTETKHEANEIANGLEGCNVQALHGDLSQGVRASTMQNFRKGLVKTLACTDIAARGLDIANVDLVVHYRLPNDRENFVHRAGRTGRAGKTGTSIVFFENQEYRDIKDLENRFKIQFAHAATPDADDFRDTKVKEVTKRLQKVSDKSSDFLSEEATKLYEAHGIRIFSAALNLLCGFEKGNTLSVSMLTGKSNMLTVQIDGLTSVSQVSELLQSAIGNSAQRDIMSVNKKFIVDIPYSSYAQLQEALQSNNVDGVTVSRVTELPHITLPLGSERSFGGGRYGDNSSGYGGGRYGGGNSGYGGGGRGSKDRNFRRNDSGDSRNSRFRPRSSNSWDNSDSNRISSRPGRSPRKRDSFEW
uniref:DEAD/DEAH box RNA helicase putative n=1 Tax=Albugo laibachii Nc14 TaxID=890382 RepID=F0WQ28_9STRA|nr:DEAD/DEAH box RNA helicase putative [Albugo laibachii Nc14]|eukprot:CCA23433.1 DEAD/DEAH box RNA helicase putative [Albugo laibachii Nc14]